MTSAYADLDRDALVEQLMRLHARAHRARVHQTLLQQTMLAAEKARQEVAALNNLKDEFLGITAHDLRSPLTVIQGFAMTMEAYPEIAESDELSEFVQLIETSAARMLALVNDLLDIAKIESGKLELDCRPSDLRGAVEENAALNRHLAEPKGIRLDAELPPHPVVANIDRERMAQVLNNLFSNAAKFSESGTTITVRLTRDDNHAAIAVEDQGQGIPPDDLPRLFERFRQTKTKSTAGEKGTGLGLAIVKKIVELHRGWIDVDSQLGAGSTFTVRLPLAQPS